MLRVLLSTGATERATDALWLEDQLGHGGVTCSTGGALVMWADFLCPASVCTCSYPLALAWASWPDSRALRKAASPLLLFLSLLLLLQQPLLCFT